MIFPGISCKFSKYMARSFQESAANSQSIWHDLSRNQLQILKVYSMIIPAISCSCYHKHAGTNAVPIVRFPSSTACTATLCGSQIRHSLESHAAAWSTDYKNRQPNLRSAKEFKETSKTQSSPLQLLKQRMASTTALILLVTCSYLPVLTAAAPDYQLQGERYGCKCINFFDWKK